MIILYWMHTKKPKKNIPLPKQLQSAWRYYCFPCAQNHAPVVYQNSEPPNQRNRSRLASRSNCTHLKEISPPQYHIYTDNTFKVCGKHSPDKKPRASLDSSTSQLELIRCNLQRNTLKRCKLVTNVWYVKNILANCDGNVYLPILHLPRVE